MMISNAADTSLFYTIYYDANAITFIRKASRSKVGRTTLRVHSDGRVVVHAPLGMTDKAVVEFAQQRAAWIWKHVQLYRQKQQNRQSQPQPAARLRYRDEERHLYLGKRYALHVIRQPDVSPSAQLVQGKLKVVVPSAYPKYIKEGLYNWYRERAKTIFQTRLGVLITKTPWVKKCPSLTVRVARRSWGSCSRDGRIALNLHLIKAPLECIDYVLLHELCHIAEHNHSPRFYALLSQVLPEWKERRATLHRLSIDLMQGALK